MMLRITSETPGSFITHGIEGGVAQKLYPDFLANVSGDRASQAGGYQSLRNLTTPIGARAIGFAERNSISLGVLDYARGGNLRRKVNDGAHDAARLDGRGNYSARIDAFQMNSLRRSAYALEIPPGNSILRAYDDSVRAQDPLQLRRKLGKAVRFHAENDHVSGSRFFQRADNSGMGLKIALGAFHLHAVLLHGLQMGATGEQRHI
jgi:hypothetical protein